MSPWAGAIRSLSAKAAIERYDLLNKPQRQSLGKRHTNTRTLGTRARTSNQSKASMATGSNPSIQVCRAPSNPPPIPVYGGKWVKRIYSSNLVTVTGTVAQNISANQLVPALDPGSTGTDKTYYIDKIQIWNVNKLNHARSSLAQGLITDLGADSVLATDLGTTSSLAGITYVVPPGHAKAVIFNDSTILTVGGVSAIYEGVYVAHTHVWIEI